MLFIVFFYSSNLPLGSLCFIRPKSFLISICSFSTFSKDISSLYILLKICIGPLNLEKLTEGILKSLKLQSTSSRSIGSKDSRILANPLRK